MASPFNTEAYLDVSTAEDYFRGRLVTDAWDEAAQDKKYKALLDATRRIDRLNFKGVRSGDMLDHTSARLPTSPNQPREFPRNGETDVPTDILIACCEIAYALLDGIDPDVEAANLGVVQQGFASLQETYDSDVVNLAFRHGIPSITAWNIMQPYLADASALLLRRA